MLRNLAPHIKPAEAAKIWPALHDAKGNVLHECPWPLPNMKQVPEYGFWSYRTSYSFDGEVWSQQRRFDAQRNLVGSREPYDRTNHSWGHVLLYLVAHGHLRGGGYAVLVRRVPQERGPEKHLVEYFEWRSCDHETESKTVGNCLTRYTCKKCGYAYEVDSSD